MITTSIWKALRDVGISVGSVAALAGLTFLLDPAAIQPILDVTPDLVDTVLILLVPLGAKTLIDYLKHRSS